MSAASDSEAGGNEGGRRAERRIVKHPAPLDGRQAVEAAFAKAESHPMRLQMLELLSRGEASCPQLAREMGRSKNQLYHHRDVLLGSGLIEFSHSRKCRGATENFYRLAPGSQAARQSLLGIPPSLRDQFSANWLQGFGDIATALRGVGADEIQRDGNVEWLVVYLDRLATDATEDALRRLFQVLAEHAKKSRQRAEVIQEPLLPFVIGAVATERDGKTR